MKRMSEAGRRISGVVGCGERCTSYLASREVAFQEFMKRFGAGEIHEDKAWNLQGWSQVLWTSWLHFEKR